MFPLIETAIAFVVIMLAASLMVTALVRLFHSFTNRRGRGVEDMLVQLHHGFRAHNDLFTRPGDDAETTFVKDILSDPMLHTSERRGGDPAKIAKAIDFIGKQDLIELIKKNSVAVEVEPEGDKAGESYTVMALPERWRPGVRPQHAKTADFIKHIDRWWYTVEGTVAQEFGEQARRLSVIISCLLVVAVNLDGFRLAWGLYQDRTLSARIAAQAEQVQRSADRLGVGKEADPLGRPPQVSRSNAKLELQLNAAVITDDQLPIGWQNAYIVKRWCAYQGCEPTTGGPTVEAPTTWQLILDVLMWLAGLAFSCMLLSQGAPFWVRVLGTVLRLRNAVQVRTEWREEREWEVEKEKRLAEAKRTGGQHYASPGSSDVGQSGA